MRTLSLGSVFAFCIVLPLAACNTSGSAVGTLPPAAPATRESNHNGSHSPIHHVVLMIQENRSYNDFFATFPGGDGTTTGYALANASCSPPISAGSIALTEMPLDLKTDLDHRWYNGYDLAYDNGKLDAFDNVPYVGTGLPECSYPYQYTNPADIAPYWTLASEYTLAEHMFTTQGSDSFTAHQDLIRGGTVVETHKAMVDLPRCSNCYWGCDSPSGTITHLITPTNTYIKNGPFPCSNKFKSKYRTLRDLLDAKSVTWKYYVPPSSEVNGKLLNAFDVIYPVRYGSEWTNNISSPETNILTDIQNGALPAMSWVIPDAANSDHPDEEVGGKYVDDGPEWIATVVNAIGESSYWKSTAIVIVWDDWGGFYDNEGGVMGAYGGPGERVPALIVSPYAKPAYISTTTYQFGSILKYIENNWKLGSLDTTDKSSKSIIDCFDYKQTPIVFKPITSSLGKAYFMHEKHTYRAPDDDW